MYITNIYNIMYITLCIMPIESYVHNMYNIIKDKERDSRKKRWKAVNAESVRYSEPYPFEPGGQ